MNDSIFGNLTFRHGWITHTEITWGNALLSIKVKNKATEEQPVTQFQRDVFSYFKANEKTILTQVKHVLADFCNKNYDSTVTADNICNSTEPVTLLIFRLSHWGLLFKVKWESEINLAVKFTDDWKIQECGVDDILL